MGRWRLVRPRGWSLGSGGGECVVWVCVFVCLWAWWWCCVLHLLRRLFKVLLIMAATGCMTG